jgi:DNA-binding ferritin-like protein
MKELAITLRALQLYAHMAHHLAGRTPFFSDHEFFGEIYSAADSNYDSVIERMIGLFGEDSIPSIQEQLPMIQQITQALPQKSVKENATYFTAVLQLQQSVCAKIEALVKSGSLPQGTVQLLGDIANQSESFQYKIKQRLKK